MYKVQVVLVPPSVRDNFVPVGFTSTLEDSSQLMTNGANQTNLPNGLENSIQNWNSTNNSMMLSSYFTQPRLKRFLMFTNPSNTLLDLADEILTKCEKMYPNVANDIEILSLQDSNSCDLDPDFVVKDVFNMDNTVRVILKDEINLDADVTQPVSLYGNAKRRKLNNGEQQAPIIQQQVSSTQQQTQNTGTLKIAKKRNSTTTARSTTNPNLRISTPLANQIFPSQASNNSDDEDDIAERSFLPPPTHPQSPPIRISSGIETSKRIKYSNNEDTVSRSETVDPDKSRQQRMLSGTPLRTDMTPNRVTLTGQRVVSESYNGTPRSNGLIFTNTTTQPSTTRRGSINNTRITSGMLTIPEPKIAEVEKELKEGPSSPASMLPPKADRIPMKKPYMEHPVVSGEESSSSSDTYDTPQNVEKSPSIRKLDNSHNETLEESPVKSSPFNTVSSQNSSERRRSSNLQSSFSKSSRDSQRLSSLEAKIENKSLSQRSIRRIDNFSEDENDDQQDELHVAKLPPKSKESKTPKVDQTNEFPDNTDMDNLDSDVSMDIENEANNTVRYTDIKDELHNKSHEPVNKEDLLNILDKPQDIKTGKNLVDETENVLLEKPTEQKESSVESVVETKLARTPSVQTRKRGAAETVKELMKSSDDVSIKKIKPSVTANKKKEPEVATDISKHTNKKRSSVSEPTKMTSPSKEKSTETAVPQKKSETTTSKENKAKKASTSPVKQGNVNLFEKFVADTSVTRRKPAYETVQLQRAAQDESEYYSTSDDSDDDSGSTKSNTKERNIQINDIMSLQKPTSKNSTKVLAPKLSKKAADVINTDKAVNDDTSSSSDASSTNEENDSESERKAILMKVTANLPAPPKPVSVIMQTKPSATSEMENYKKPTKVTKAKTHTLSTIANKNQRVYQSPEFVSSSEEEDESTDTERTSSQKIPKSKSQDTPVTKQESKPNDIQKSGVASESKIDTKEELNSKPAAKKKTEASTKVTNTSKEAPKTEPTSKKTAEDNKKPSTTEKAKTAKQTANNAVNNTQTKAAKKATASPSKAVVEKSEPKTSNLADKRTENSETKSSSSISKASDNNKSTEANNKVQVNNVKPAVKENAKEEIQPAKKVNAKSAIKETAKEERQLTKEKNIKAKKVESKVASPDASISKSNNTKKTDIKVTTPKTNGKEEPTKKDLRKEPTKPKAKPSSEESSSGSSSDSSSSSESDDSSASGSESGSSSSGSGSDSESSSDESSSDEESNSSARVSRRMIVAPPKGLLSETKPSNVKDTTSKVEDVPAIDEVPQSTQQPSKQASKAIKQPSMNRPPLKSASKDTTISSSQPTEPTISNISSQPPKLDDPKSSPNTSKVESASPLSNLPRKYRPSLSSLSDLVSRGIPAVKDKHDKAGAPSLAKRGKEIKKDGSMSESSSSSSESESDSSADSGSSDSSSDSGSSSGSDSDSDSSSSEEETYISAKSANAALNKKKKKTNGGGGFASLIKDSKKHK